jgi:Domain of unknown function (DUF4432)
VRRYARQRNWGARVHEYVLQGMRAVFLENEWLRIGILADKGTDLFELLYKPRDLDFAWLSANGVQNPVVYSAGNSDAVASFLDSYPGGWQEILPNGGAPCSYGGVSYGQHGEVSVVPWDYEVVADDEREVAVRFSVAGRKSPFRVVKEVRLKANEPGFSIEETVENEGASPAHLMWGHHITFGPPFLRPGARISLPDGVEVIPHVERLNPDRRRVASEGGRWPSLAAEGGGELDLSLVPDRGEPSEIVYLTGFPEGRYEVRDPDGLGLRVEWDASVMPYVWFWQEFGATRGYPWYGRHYNIGLEPFTSYPTNGLEEAVRLGTAVELGAGEQRDFRLVATVLEP